MRLIDADRAIEIVRDQGIAHPNAYHLTNYATLILREAPTVDAVEVVHGRWLCVDTDEEQFFLCNRCKKKEFLQSNYCRSCGAKMDGGTDNGC